MNCADVEVLYYMRRDKQRVQGLFNLDSLGKGSFVFVCLRDVGCALHCDERHAWSRGELPVGDHAEATIPAHIAGKHASVAEHLFDNRGMTQAGCTLYTWL